MKLKVIVKKFNSKKLIFRIKYLKKEYPRFIDVEIIRNDFYLNDANSNSKILLWFNRIILNSKCKSDSLACYNEKMFKNDLYYFYNSKIMQDPRHSYKLILTLDEEEI